MVESVSKLNVNPRPRPAGITLNSVTFALLGLIFLLGGGYLKDRVDASSAGAAVAVKVEANDRRIDELRAAFGDHTRNAPTRDEYVRLSADQKLSVTRDEIGMLTKGLEGRLDEMRTELKEVGTMLKENRRR